MKNLIDEGDLFMSQTKFKNPVFLENLKNLSLEMRKHEIGVATFDLMYEQKGFSCIYIDEENSPLFIITTVGKNAFSSVFEGDENFSFESNIGGKYNLLYKYLEIISGPGEPFNTSKFLRKLTLSVNYSKDYMTDPSKVVEIYASTGKKVEERDKPYFWYWWHHPWKKTSKDNFQKTQLIVGATIAKTLKDKRISSCWSADLENYHPEKISQYSDLF